jgi:transposase-like protein
MTTATETWKKPVTCAHCEHPQEVSIPAFRGSAAAQPDQEFLCEKCGEWFCDLPPVK